MSIPEPYAKASALLNKGGIMISGNDIRRVKKYLPLDFAAQECGWVEPKQFQKFIGVPYSYYSDNSFPFIEVYEDNVLVKTINILGIDEIEFE